MREFSDLGAGFRVAALDLELRGAGNLLGGEQSGHIQAVGLDLYVKLLEQTILELKGEAGAGEGPGPPEPRGAPRLPPGDGAGGAPPPGPYKPRGPGGPPPPVH